MSSLFRRSFSRLARTNRYTDGSGRALESNVLPNDLYIPTISNRAYPRQGEHWQPTTTLTRPVGTALVDVNKSADASKEVVDADSQKVTTVVVPSLHKGNVIVSGGGVVGLTTAVLWGLRGWHTTVIERSPPLSCVRKDSRSSLTSSSGSLRRPHFSSPSEKVSCTDVSEPFPPSMWPPFIELQYALVTRRAADVLSAAGLPVSVLQECGVTVTGILDHPGAYHNWLSRGLTELHPFATKVLSIDLWALREKLEHHVGYGLPNENVRVFYEHEVEAVYPLRQEAVVRPIENGGHKEANGKPKKLPTSLSLTPMKWEKSYANEAVKYDLLVSAEGVNSKMRDLLDVEGFSADSNFAVKWFLLRTRRRRASTPPSSESPNTEGAFSSSLSPTHIHRWLHAVPTSAKNYNNYGVQSPHPVPLVIAFPRIENKNKMEWRNDADEAEEQYYYFSVMAYMPREVLAVISDEDFFRTYLTDVWNEENKFANNPTGKEVAHPADSETTRSVQFDKDNSSCAHSGSPSLISFSKDCVSAPTVFCEQLYNSVGLPNAVLVGDASHFCNPFWLQQLSMGLEDSLHLLQHVDAYSRHIYDAIKQYSDERGASGDALRELTDQCLYYQRNKYRNPFLRLRNVYHQWMNRITPVRINDWYDGSTNHVYSRSIEEMLNGKGYTSYEFAEKQQSKHRMFYHIGRLYT